jgi:rhodanese-related sulfurtransferase
MVANIDATTLKAWLSDEREIALLDVREHGQYGEGHPFFAVPLPYSRFELSLAKLVPNPAVRLVLCDGDDGVAERAAARAEALGYHNVHIVRGGAQAWRRAGYTLFAGVNVPSKTFGELVEQQRHTPRVTAKQLQAMREAGENLAIVDGRPLAEYRRMNIPGGICCPNGELVLRIRDIVPDPKTKIIVNCAGRTRSIIGAQTLIDLGVPNPVYALENGTQGWFLAGLNLEHGADRRYSDAIRTADFPRLQARARALARGRKAAFASSREVDTWLADPSRTTYVLDVRTSEEFAANGVPPIVHAPGGQLMQATDQWVGVKGARIVLVDAESVRAPVVAAWLRQLGHEACVLEGGVAAARELSSRRPSSASPGLHQPRAMAPAELADASRQGMVQIIDLRPSMTYRKAHIPGAVWSIRPRIASAVTDGASPVVLVANEPDVAALAARDLAELGCSDTRLLAGGFDAWCDAGLPVVATPNHPPDAECIDFLFFTAARHDGDAEAARRYLAWETGLIDQLDPQERSVFRISAAP